MRILEGYECSHRLQQMFFVILHPAFYFLLNFHLVVILHLFDGFPTCFQLVNECPSGEIQFNERDR
jgi:hypothetical protein